MAGAKVQYVVEVTKAGSGGRDAAAELQTAAQAASAVNSAAAATNAGMTSLQTTTKTTGVVFKSLGGVLQVAGFQQFPQLTSAAMVTQQALNAVRSSGVQLTASFGTIGAGVAGLAALVVSAAFAWSAYSAEKQEALSKLSADEAALDFAKRLQTQVLSLYAAGRLTKDMFEELNKSLRGTDAGNQRVRDYIRALERGTAADRITAFERNEANVRAKVENAVADPRNRGAFPGGVASFAGQADATNTLYKERIELYRKLYSEGLMTIEQLRAAEMDADTQKLNSLTAIQRSLEATKIKMMDLRDIEKDAITNFASGLASTLVDVRAWTKDAGAAFASFFSQLASSIAQAIMQMLILRALKGAFPSFFGAAHGGVFPRMMATGGIQTVSSATYFPKFNVVAGEAGSEMLAVLSRPRMMNLGGIEAAVGMAQGNKLALTSADALARGGAGGAVQIHVTMDPGLRATIVQDSVQGAVVRVTQDVNRNTALREAVRKA